jgi:hypothetical protein
MSKDIGWILDRIAGDYGVYIPIDPSIEIGKDWAREPSHDDEAAVAFLARMGFLTPEILARGPIYRVKPVDNVIELYNEAMRYDLRIPEDVEDEARERFDKEPGRNQESAHRVLVDLGVLTPEVLAKGPMFPGNPVEGKTRHLEQKIAEMYGDGRQTDSVD